MWAQQGSKLVGSENIGYSRQGKSVSINSDGTTVVVGGNGDNGNKGLYGYSTVKNNIYNYKN